MRDGSDDMLKVGGIWVSPMEVESVLISHEAVAECAVVAFRDGSLYVADVTRILRYDSIEAKLSVPPEPTVVRSDFPANGCRFAGTPRAFLW